MAQCHAIIPLALLESMRALDVSTDQELQELWNEQAPKKLGSSATVAAQIERYRRLTRRDARVQLDEVHALFRLIGRRRDAHTVLAEAGHLASERAGQRLGRGLDLLFRVMPRPLRPALGFRLARRVAREVFDVGMTPDGNATLTNSALAGSATQTTPDTDRCVFYEAAINGLVTRFDPFPGMMAHTTCRHRGDTQCRWTAADLRGTSR